MLTALLAKVLGVYLIIVGLLCLFRRQYILAALAGFVENKALRFVVAACELIAGLFLVFTHEIWTNGPGVIVSLFGWAMLIEGFVYLFIPDRYFSKMAKKFQHKAWYIVGGLISIVLGVYLAYAGLILG